MQVTLENVTNLQKVSKNNKPYIACTIQVNGMEYRGFGNQVTQMWQPGQQVDVELFEEPFNGKMYKKFKLPGEGAAVPVPGAAPQAAPMVDNTQVILNELKAIRAAIEELKNLGTPSTLKPVEETVVEDLPF